VISVQTTIGYEQRPIDPDTLAIGAPLMQSAGNVSLDPTGFLGMAGGPRWIGDEADVTFTQYGFHGAPRWEHTFTHVAGAPHAAIGDYLYVGTGTRDQVDAEAMHVLDLATGREVASRPGFWNVFGRGDSGEVHGTMGEPD
jgi:hypothetical protein